MSRALLDELSDQITDRARRVARKHFRQDRVAQTVEDIAQEVWVVMLERERDQPNYFEDEQSVLRFAAVTAVLKRLERWRKIGKEKRVVSDVAAVLSHPDKTASDPFWAKLLERFPTCEAIAAPLVSVSVVLASVIRLRCEEKTWEEVAAAIRQSVSSAKRYYADALRYLNRIAADNDPGDIP